MAVIENIDFKNSTIFDFTEDKKVIEEIVGSSSSTKDEYMSYVHPDSRIFHLFCLAEMTNDADLQKALDSEYSDFMASFFNE